MWKPPINFLTLHYTYIITCSLLAFIVVVGPGSVPATDAFFFGVSGSTESGLNTIDVKEIRLYQQVVIYITPRGRSLERVASSTSSIGPKQRGKSRRSTSRDRSLPKGMPKLSEQITSGRNSHFHNMSTENVEILGGVEYVALKLLLKLIVGYFFGFHLLGLICLLR